jgi:hypothetical protein
MSYGEDGTLTAAAEREVRANIQAQLRAQPSKGIVYISGPMTGHADFNYPAFHAAAEKWRAAGWEVLNPADNLNGETTHSYATYIREDLKMLGRATAIAMLPGWTQSRGAKLELLIAQALNLPVYIAAEVGVRSRGWHVETEVR